jgi:hypothetical protein
MALVQRRRLGELFGHAQHGGTRARVGRQFGIGRKLRLADRRQLRGRPWRLFCTRPE